jgi:NADH:ubiquinone oxidoreductase subunit 4 (subunit M)
VRDLLPGELLVILPLLALIVYLGVQPGMLVSRMESSVARTLCARFIGVAPEACFGPGARTP